MTSHITTEDREAAEKFCEGFIGHHPMSALDKRSKDGFLSGIIYCRSQPDSEFQKGVASVQSQLTEARERLRVAAKILKHNVCPVSSGDECWACRTLAQIQEPNGKKEG